MYLLLAFVGILTCATVRLGAWVVDIKVTVQCIYDYKATHPNLEAGMLLMTMHAYKFGCVAYTVQCALQFAYIPVTCNCERICCVIIHQLVNS